MGQYLDYYSQRLSAVCWRVRVLRDAEVCLCTRVFTGAGRQGLSYTRPHDMSTLTPGAAHSELLHSSCCFSPLPSAFGVEW